MTNASVRSELQAILADLTMSNPRTREYGVGCVCTKCGRGGDENFHATRHGTLGSWCKDCVVAATARWRKRKAQRKADQEATAP